MRERPNTSPNNAKMSEKLGLRLTWRHPFMPKKDPDWGAIAAYMIDRRTHLGWTQEYAAKKADLSKDTWNALERERKKGVKAITLVNIARALGEEPREFLAIAKISGLNGRPDD